jgi:hypothetical protein
VAGQGLHITGKGRNFAAGKRTKEKKSTIKDFIGENIWQVRQNALSLPKQSEK